MLPYLELGMSVTQHGAALVDRLRICRIGGRGLHADLEDEMYDRMVPEHVIVFLMRWVRGQVEVFGPVR
ncbi:hypothetical protein [Mangrovihabitans endophyticus]|uniref:Uncharacterized protein n=1 Tax=Mangrovihabitans endophyticus TaxID=1751298 RepID=A0A8J3FR87_9ACTN|nr:hypothetical protein [Mangrovihabitans endophyticus]GGL04508.1 hypothetical protein GCM10012284_43900 [Mangrovihabitans endophyticus]